MIEGAVHYLDVRGWKPDPQGNVREMLQLGNDASLRITLESSGHTSSGSSKESSMALP